MRVLEWKRRDVKPLIRVPKVIVLEVETLNPKPLKLRVTRLHGRVWQDFAVLFLAQPEPKLLVGPRAHIGGLGFFLVYKGFPKLGVPFWQAPE